MLLLLLTNLVWWNRTLHLMLLLLPVVLRFLSSRLRSVLAGRLQPCCLAINSSQVDTILNVTLLLLLLLLFSGAGQPWAATGCCCDNGICCLG